MQPYYEHAGITIYHCDCRDVLPELSGDAVVTDTPYGIGFNYASYEDSRENWEDLIVTTMPLLFLTAPFIVLPCCGIGRIGWWYQRFNPTWMIAWFKGSPGHQSPIGFNDWEAHLVWGRPNNRSMHDHFQTPCGFEPNGHPCPKPLSWAKWLVSRSCDPGATVIDPFMGSGTVLEAAKNLGRKAIGIEIEERYCEIAAKRLAQEVLPLEIG